MNQTVTIVTRACPFCARPGKEVTMPIVAARRWNYGRGELLQFAWPEGSQSDREALLTGMCDVCFPTDKEE